MREGTAVQTRPVMSVVETGATNAVCEENHTPIVRQVAVGMNAAMAGEQQPATNVLMRVTQNQTTTSPWRQTLHRIQTQAGTQP